MTNDEFVDDLMTFSPTGAMSQIFILEAIRKYAEQIEQREDYVREEMKDGFIHPDAWIKTAKHINTKFNERNAA